MAVNFHRIQQTEWNGADPYYPIFSLSFLYLALSAIGLLQRHKNEKLLKQEFVTGANLDSKSLVAKDMLGLLLPKFVLDEMKNPFEFGSEAGGCLSREVGDVTILFCDIADFDNIIRKHEDKVVELLDRIVRRFDDLCVLHGIQKIETVGKTYMAAGGLIQVEEALPPDLKVLNPTARVLNLAKDMMKYMKDCDGLQLKIGIHVGQPVMGVIGYHKPQFSLIGDAVNTTSRCCTTGQKGRIMISKEAYDALEQIDTATRGYKCEKVPTEMKGKGTVIVYHLYQATSLFSQKLRKIIGRSSQLLNSEQVRQINILTKVAHRAIEAETDPDGPEEGGFYSAVLKNSNQQSLNALYRNSMGRSPSKRERPVPALGDTFIPNKTFISQPANANRATSRFGTVTVPRRNSRSLAHPSSMSRFENFEIEDNVFEITEQERFEDEVLYSSAD